MQIETDSAQVRIPPPLVVLGCVVLAFILRGLLPAPFLTESARWTVGWLLVLVGLSFMIWAVYCFKKNKTNIPPWQPVLHFVKEGPYRFTRNPMYVSFIVLTTGFVCLANNLYALVLIPLLYLFLRYYVIVKEEKYLDSKFGEEYRTFCQSVRRWL